MKKKFLAIAVAAAMAFSTVSALPVNTTVAQAAEPTDISEVVGAEDNSAGFWSAFSKQYKIESDKSYVFDFENHSDGGAFFHNYVMVFTNEAAYNGQGQSDNYFEYAVIRADNWGWSVPDGTMTENLAHNGTEIVKGGTIGECLADVATYNEYIQDSNVTLTIKRKDDLVATEAVVTSIADPTKSYTYTATFSMDTSDGDLYFGMTLEKAHLVMKTMSVSELSAETVTTTDISEVVGAEDNSAGFWSAFSKQYKIESDKTYVFDFENHSDGGAFFHNYVMVFTNEAAYNGQGQSDNYFEYAVIRADNWGWSVPDGTMTENLAHNGTEIVKGGTIGECLADVATYNEYIQDSNVTLTINRKGDLVATEAVVTSIADPSKSYTYTATFSMDTADGDLYFGMTLENAHLVMKTMTVKELSAAMPDAPQPGEVTPPTPPANKQIMLSDVSAKLGAKKVTGTVNAPNATVKVQVNKTAAVTATVKDKKFTANLKSKLKAGDTVKITVTAEGYYDKDQSVTVKGTMKISKVTAKKGAKTITGTVSEKKATVKIKVGSKAYKKAKVSGKNFTLKVAKLKKGTKVTVKATKKNYKTVTKSVKVK